MMTRHIFHTKDGTPLKTSSVILDRFKSILNYKALNRTLKFKALT